MGRFRYVTSALRCTAVAALLLLGASAAADAQNACGIPPSGLVRLWDGVGCQGQSIDFTASSIVTAFPAYSISNGTGHWIAVTDTINPSRADHTLLIQDGCYYPDLSAFHWEDGESWVGHIRAIQILPSGTGPATYPAAGNRVIGRCR